MEFPLFPQYLSNTRTQTQVRVGGLRKTQRFPSRILFHSWRLLACSRVTIVEQAPSKKLLIPSESLHRVKTSTNLISRVFGSGFNFLVCPRVFFDVAAATTGNYPLRYWLPTSLRSCLSPASIRYFVSKKNDEKEQLPHCENVMGRYAHWPRPFIIFIYIYLCRCVYFFHLQLLTFQTLCNVHREHVGVIRNMVIGTVKQEAILESVVECLLRPRTLKWHFEERSIDRKTPTKIADFYQYETILRCILPDLTNSILIKNLYLQIWRELCLR